MKSVYRAFLLVIILLPSLAIAQAPCPFQVNLGNDTMICNGSSLTLNAEVPGATYFWSDWSTSPGIQVFFEGEYTVTVTKDGCEVNDTIYVGLKPSLYTEFNYVAGPTHGRIQFSSTSSSCDGTVAGWDWDFGDGQTSAQENPLHIYTTPGNYDVTLAVKDNWGSIYATVQTITIEFTTDSTGNEPSNNPEPVNEPEPNDGTDSIPAPVIDPGPRPVDTISTTDTVINKCINIPKPLIIQKENTLKTGNAVSYQWFKEGRLIDGVDDNSIRINQQGYYSVKVFDSQGCESESDPFFFAPQREASPGEIYVRCSPNPAHGIINIMLSEIPGNPAKLTIYNLHGLQVFTTQLKDRATSVNGIRLSKGMYMVEILAGGKRKTITAVVQ